jgi:alkanesulfonate monooxygenase SsuD/methylene tetrahydromethanopterin reductase-like flavin-dependent oxidoreductase (luciferase family)
MPRFGLICPIQSRDVGLDQLLAELSEEVQAAERAGFDAFFFPEFHQAHGGALVSPMLVGSWLLSRTHRIRMGGLVLAAPLHDPVRLAEDLIMLDWASSGRVILGLGSAHLPADFGLYGRPRARRQLILDELLDVLDRCFAGEPFDYQGEFFQRRGHVTPRPYTPPRPPLWIGAHGPRGLRRAGERADAWVCDPQRDIDHVAVLARQYRAAADAAGRPSQTVLFREAWIADSAEECEAVWTPHVMKVHRLYYNVGVYHREFEPWVDEVADRADFTLDRLAPGRFLYGSPDEVRATADGWLRRTGADYMAVRLRHPTGPSHEETLVAIERFGESVIAPLSRSADREAA